MLIIHALLFNWRGLYLFDQLNIYVRMNIHFLTFIWITKLFIAFWKTNINGIHTCLPAKLATAWQKVPQENYKRQTDIIAKLAVVIFL